MTELTLTEGDLLLTINGAIGARKFDDANHGLSHCMKAVDFIVERPNCYLFIEFKDPQNPNAKAKDQKKFVNRFKSGQLDEDLKLKFRDSFLYEWAEGRADNKPIHYLVLVALNSLTKADLGKRTDALKQYLPLQRSKPGPWPRPFVSSCNVFNLTTWNQHNLDLPVSRLSTI
jgi:hypothetical protein